MLLARQARAADPARSRRPPPRRRTEACWIPSPRPAYASAAPESTPSRPRDAPGGERAAEPAPRARLPAHARGDRPRASSGVRGLAIRLARAINRALVRQGRVWDDRYHRHDLATPREVRHALVYVLNNVKKHMHSFTGLDPCSSARWFAGWAIRPPTALPRRVAVPVLEAKTWFLAMEAFLGGGTPVSVAVLRRRIEAVLGQPSTHRSWFGKLYEARSRIAHGMMPLLRPGQLLDEDAGLDIVEQISHLIEEGLTVVVALVQALVKSDARGFRIAETVAIAADPA